MPSGKYQLIISYSSLCSSSKDNNSPAIMIPNHIKGGGGGDDDDNLKSKRKKGNHSRPIMIRTLGSSLQVRTEQKATQVLGLVFFLFIICWAPFFTRNLIEIFCPHLYMPDCLPTIFQQLGFFSSTINPLIYTVFNRNFRRAFRRILLCKTAKYNLKRRQHQQALNCTQNRENLIDREMRTQSVHNHHLIHCDQVTRLNSMCKEAYLNRKIGNCKNADINPTSYTHDFTCQNVAYYWKFKGNNHDFHDNIFAGESSEV